MDPVGAAVDVLGDRWTLLILRDVMLEDRRYFRALLTASPEGIASNILADRLVKLVDAGLLRRGTAARGQRARYSLTEAGIQAASVLCALEEWGRTWRPRAGEGGAVEGLEREAGCSGGAAAHLMDDLRRRHLDLDQPGAS
jgi:DNA-binding HxlR family transcriptional regulator